MSSLGMILVALLLLATVITWGTSYGMLCPILALIVTIMEFVKPWVPPLDPKNPMGDPK